MRIRIEGTETRLPQLRASPTRPPLPDRRHPASCPGLQIRPLRREVNTVRDLLARLAVLMGAPCPWGCYKVKRNGQWVCVTCGN